MKIALRAVAASVFQLALFGLLLFLPAGTLNYWQGWAVIGVFAVMMSAIFIYLMIKSPAALKRRMTGGPTAETRPAQKVASAGLFLAVGAVMVFCALDHRFGWSPVPTAVSLAGFVLLVLGIGIGSLVIIQNSYASGNINVEDEQKVVSSGLYGLVRHPMYTGSLIMLVGLPLALDSYWGLLVLIPVAVLYAVRVSDEEKVLHQELAGYTEYTQQVQYRLVPYMW